MAVRYINFHSIPVRDQNRAIAFYRDALGFSVQVDVPYAEGWRWIFMTLPDSQCRLQFGRTSEHAVTGVPALTLVCDSVDDEAARLGAAGVTITGGPDDAPWAAPGVRWMTIEDSEGNAVLLESMKGA
jgi:predicted enzyme related to lactoylglutathione lyase